MANWLQIRVFGLTILKRPVPGALEITLSVNGWHFDLDETRLGHPNYRMLDVNAHVAGRIVPVALSAFRPAIWPFWKRVGNGYLIELDLDKDPGTQHWWIRTVGNGFDVEVHFRITPFPNALSEWGPPIPIAYEKLDGLGELQDLQQDARATFQDGAIVYEYGPEHLAFGARRMSSLFLPRGDYKVELFDHDPRKGEHGEVLVLENREEGWPQIFNLIDSATGRNETRWDDRVCFVRLRRMFPMQGNRNLGPVQIIPVGMPIAEYLKKRRA